MNFAQYHAEEIPSHGWLRLHFIHSYCHIILHPLHVPQPTYLSHCWEHLGRLPFGASVAGAITNGLPCLSVNTCTGSCLACAGERNHEVTGFASCQISWVLPEQLCKFTLLPVSQRPSQICERKNSNAPSGNKYTLKKPLLRQVRTGLRAQVLNVFVAVLEQKKEYTLGFLQGRRPGRSVCWEAVRTPFQDEWIM